MVVRSLSTPEKSSEHRSAAASGGGIDDEEAAHRIDRIITSSSHPDNNKTTTRKPRNNLKPTNGRNHILCVQHIILCTEYVQQAVLSSAAVRVVHHPHAAGDSTGTVYINTVLYVLVVVDESPSLLCFFLARSRQQQQVYCNVRQNNQPPKKTTQLPAGPVPVLYYYCTGTYDDGGRIPGIRATYYDVRRVVRRKLFFASHYCIAHSCSMVEFG